MLLQEKLKYCQNNKSALLATNFYNFETLRGVLEAAKLTNSSIILQLTKSSIDYMGLEIAVAMGRAGLKSFGVEGWIHLDHCNSIDLIKKCLDAGFDSVMFDGSELDINKNILLTKEVVKLAESYNANVEAELGYVAKLGQSKEKLDYTNANDAKTFVEETRVNSLAIAIGTAHGFYKSEPKLDFQRLQEIKNATSAALVLHGGSGVPAQSIQKAISLGICKVNLATEIKNIFTQTLQTELINNKEIDLRITFPPAIKAITELVAGKLKLMN